MKVYTFDLDRNIFDNPDTPIYLERKGKDGTWEEFCLPAVEYDKQKKSRDRTTIRYKNNEQAEALQEYYDHGPRGEQALIEDILTGQTHRSHDHLIKAVTQADIIRTLTARGHAENTIRKAFKHYLHETLSSEQMEEFRENFHKKYNNPNSGKIALYNYLDRMNFYAVHHPALSKKLGLQNIPTPRKKALTLWYDLNILEHNPMQFIAQSKQEKEYGFSDDTPANTQLASEYLKYLKKNGRFPEWKIVIRDTFDPSNIQKTVIK